MASAHCVPSKVQRVYMAESIPATGDGDPTTTIVSTPQIIVFNPANRVWTPTPDLAQTTEGRCLLSRPPSEGGSSSGENSPYSLVSEYPIFELIS
jgi:hypothetical protein